MKNHSIVILLLSFFVCNSCNRNPYKASNKLYRAQAKAFAKALRQEPSDAGIDSVLQPPYFVGTINFNLRKPNFIIIHHTAQNSCEQTLKTFTMMQSQVSAHYVICKDGIVHHMLNDCMRAWHGGIAKWGNLTDVNSSSIGIELDNNGYEIFTDAQIQSLLHVLDALKKKYNIPQANFIGHGDIAPTRKNDPNVYFPWQLQATKGFGMWYGDTANIVVPDAFNNTQALRIIGYDVRDTSAAIIAFKRHFEQDTTSAIITDADKKILYNLSLQYQ